MNRREMITLLGALSMPSAVWARAVPSEDQFTPTMADNGWQILGPLQSDKRLIIQWGRSDANGHVAFPLAMNPLSVMAGGQGDPIPITRIDHLGADLKAGEYWVALGEIDG